MNIKIEALLNKNEKGCNYSSYFIESWVNNTKMHPMVKSIPVNKTYHEGEPIITVLKDESVIFQQKGNEIGTATLQEFLLNELGVINND